MPDYWTGIIGSEVRPWRQAVDLHRATLRSDASDELNLDEFLTEFAQGGCQSLEWLRKAELPAVKSFGMEAERQFFAYANNRYKIAAESTAPVGELKRQPYAEYFMRFGSADGLIKCEFDVDVKHPVEFAGFDARIWQHMEWAKKNPRAVFVGKAFCKIKVISSPPPPGRDDWWSTADRINGVGMEFRLTVRDTETVLKVFDRVIRKRILPAINKRQPEDSCKIFEPYENWLHQEVKDAMSKAFLEAVEETMPWPPHYEPILL